MALVKKVCKTPPLPNNEVLDTPSNCFKKGRKVGFYIGATVEKKKGKEMRKQLEKQHEKKITKTRLEGKLEKKKLMDDIKSKGLSSLKNALRLSELSKDEIRSIAVRYTGTPNMIPNYSRMNLDQLRQELQNRGWNL